MPKVIDPPKEPQIQWTAEFIGSLPRPAGGSLIVDEKLSVIHGVALIGLQSVNDGVLFSKEAKQDFADRMNSSLKPITVQMGHFEKHTLEENGGVVNLYLDGDTLRGSHFLNPHNDDTAVLLYNAKFFQGNQCYSMEARNSDLTYGRENGKRVITKIKSLKWFALDRSCGTTDGMNHSLIRDEGRKMATRPKTPEELKRRYPDLYEKLEEGIRAECQCEIKERAESDQAIQEIKDENEVLKATNAKLVEEVNSFKDQAVAATRSKELRTEWDELMKDIDVSLLPETEAGDLIKKLAVLSDEEITGLVAEGDKATETLKLRAATISNNLVLAEKNRKSTPTYVPKKKNDDEDEGKATYVPAIDLGGGITFGG